MQDICTFLVGVAQGASLSIQQILELNSRRKLTKANFKVKGDIFTTVVERNDRATDLVQAGFEILLLPHPEDVVDVAMVEVEYRLTGAIVRITSLSESTSDTEVTASVDVRNGEAGLAFNSPGKASVVLLGEDVVDELLVRPDVDQSRDEIALETVGSGEVD